MNFSLKLTSHNVRSLWSKSTDMQTLLQNEQFSDIMLFQEVNIDEDRKLDTVKRRFNNAGYMIHSGVSSTIGGVAIAHKSHLHSSVCYRSTDNRILSIKIHTNPVNLGVICVYGFSRSKSRQEYLQFYSRIKHAIQMTQCTHYIVGGDWNSVMNREIDVSNEHEIDGSQFLQQFVRDNSLVDVHRLFYPNKKEFTYFRNEYGSRLDILFTSAQIQPISSKIEQSSLIDSDHLMVSLQIHLFNPGMKRNNQKSIRYNFNEENRSSRWKKFTENVSDSLSDCDTSILIPTTLEESEQSLSELTNILHKAGSNSFERIDSSKKSELSTDRVKLIEINSQIKDISKAKSNLLRSVLYGSILSDRTKLQLDLLQCMEQTVESKYKFICDKLQKLFTERKKMKREMKRKEKDSDELRDMFYKNQTQFYDKVLQRKNAKISLFAVENSDGNITTDPDLVKSEAMKFYTNLYSESPDPKLPKPWLDPKYWPNKDNLQETYLLLTPITNQEVKDAMDRLKSGKSPGIDDIPPEFIKHCPPKAVELLTNVYNTWMENNDQPDSSLVGIIHMIYKDNEP
jgi:exonuclease III